MFPLKVGVLATPPQLAGVEPSSGGWRGMDVLEGQLWFGMRSSAARLCPAHTRKKKHSDCQKSWEETPRWAEIITSGKALGGFSHLCPPLALG